MAKNRKISGSTQNELVQCDLEFPDFRVAVEKLQAIQQEQLLNCIEKIQKMTWAQVYATSSKCTGKRGVNWEVLPNQWTADGGVIASIRVTDKFRARVTRDGVFMRFISLHPDHDSAYKVHGGENI